ncbi:MAG: methionine synthase, partial [Pseudomonadales bacterium]|nr:methionine synthase [Pseudomonadales bacterium]
GLSGLITPSLDEMVYVAAEMERQGFAIPLLIGGATTSKAHTAVKIEPAYRRGATVYVTDASRSVKVASSLISEELRGDFIESLRVEYDEVRTRTEARGSARKLLTLDEARGLAPVLDWETYSPPVPRQPGVHTIDVSLETLVPYIDWTPFFMTWELAGKYPKILDDAVVGSAARELFRDASEMLQTIIADGRMVARGVVGLWPCNRVGDEELAVYSDESRTTEIARLQHLRQQTVKPDENPNYSLADFIAPPPHADYIGGFAVTSGSGIELLLADHAEDDYACIMIKALADRLAEAFAEYLHREVRLKYWGYARGENLGYDALVREEYQGIRTAPGYPACPEHSEKETLFRLLEAEARTGIRLTESYAMDPAASVSGWFLSHPQARYFGIGKIGSDQVADYARRKAVDIATAQRLLRPLL